MTPGEVLDARADVERLAAAIALAQQRLAHHQRIERRHEGAHREAVDRRRRDDREIAHAGQCELQRARDRRRGQRQHMHLGAQLLELLLVRDAEMLLLVDDQQREVPELDALAEQRMGADDDVDRAVGQPLLDLGELGARDQPRGLRDLDREAAEALGEGLGVLARQQRRRHHDRDLPAAHGGDEGRAQRHLGLAETDVAADQAIHRPAGAEIAQHRVDRGLLVVGLLVGEAGAELVERPVLGHELRRLAQLPLGGDLDQVVGDLEDAPAHARLARLPGAAAEPVEIDVALLRAVAREQFDVLDRQVELVAAGVVDFEAVVRRARRLDRAQPDETADAVIDVHDEVAGRQRGDFGDEVVGALGGAARPHQPVAEDVLLADDRGVGGLEAGFEAEHRQRDLRLRQRQRLLPGGDRREIGRARDRRAHGSRARASRRSTAPRWRACRRPAAPARARSPPRTRSCRARRARRRNCGPARVPTSIAGPCPSGTANGVSRATCACLSRSSHSALPR